LADADELMRRAAAASRTMPKPRTCSHYRPPISKTAEAIDHLRRHRD